MVPVDFYPWISVAVIIAVFVALQYSRGGPSDLIFLGGLMLVTLAGIISPETAFSGFSNPAVIAIAGLLVVSAGLRSAGVLDWLGRKLLGSANDERSALRRLTPVLISASAFVLNTALVAMLMPVVLDWCRRRNISPSRLLMPISYLSILGGVCTLIGTSTTLVIQGQLRQLQSFYVEQQNLAPLIEKGQQPFASFIESLRPLTFLEPGYVGLPCAIAGGIALWFVGRRLIAERKEVVEDFGIHRREYLVELQVTSTCPLAGKTVESAGLRQLPGLFLIEIDREGDVLTPVAPHHVIQIDDRLVFTGVVNTIVDLEKIPGLVPTADLMYDSDPVSRQQRRLTEVVLSRSSPLIGRTLREANFRRMYNAAVVAVHRSGQRVTTKLGSIRLEPGDTLLLQTRSDFVAQYRNHRDFYLVSGVEGSEPLRYHKLPLAAALSAIMILWLVAANFIDREGPFASLSSVAVAAVTMAGLMVGTRCLRISEARNSIDLQMLFTIAASIGLGAALHQSGAARAIAQTFVDLVGNNPHLMLVVVYLLSMACTEAISNAAVAAMMLPLAASVAWESGCDPRPFVMAVTMAASLAFLTPIGYQTNLMVMGPAGYRPSDYFRMGWPISLAVSITSLILIPWIWPLRG